MTDIYKQKAIELLKPPFRYDPFGGYIWDSENNMVADQGDCETGTIARVRGWGRLSYLEDGDKIQDAMGQILADALNLYFEKLKETDHKEFLDIDALEIEAYMNNKVNNQKG